MTTPNLDFRNIRQWRGSQHQAFEELCYQLRDPVPEGAELVKTGNPDGGLEWYITRRNGTQWGWQAKYSFDIDNLLKGMEKSLKTVVEKRPNCRRLTFCIPFDLPDAVDEGKRKSARQKFEDKKESQRKRIPGADCVRIELWSEGDLLERLVRHPGQRGIRRFFWDKEVFSPEWCAHRMSIAHDMAGRRYTPELHIDLPVSFALEGLAMSEAYWQRLRDVRDSVLRAAERIQVSRYTRLSVTNQLCQLKKKLAEWQHATPEKTTLPKRLDQSGLLALTRGCMDFIRDADPPRPPQGQKTRTQQQRVTEEHILSLSHYLRSVESGLREFQRLLLSDASEAATNGALLLEGSAGQGKTHLFCDVGDRAVKAGQPAVVILGGSLSGRNIWSEIAKQLGLEEVGSEELASAMQAAAAASNAPFLLMVDALNEAADPAAWQEELPRLLAEVTHNPWISVAVSVRSTFLGMVLPEGGLSNVTEVEHPGFDGRELEATERFFDAFGLEQPRIPLLTPEFTNPLFLKLYCESLHGMGLSAPPLGEAHLSQTFERYLKWKEQRIAQQLKMDPALRPMQAAIDGFSKALVEANGDSLPYERASDLINAFEQGSRQWPDTLFGQLLSEGVLSKDVAWDFGAKELRQVVRFTYQQFADYQVVSILLDPFGSDAGSLRQALSLGEPLRQTLLDAPPSWIEALAVLVPERFGVELLDTADWDLEPYARRVWTSAHMKSICVRRPLAVTERTSELLADAREPDPYLEEPMLEIWLSVATQPQHLLNAYSLHEALKGMSMPNRDVAWSLPTYHTLDEGGPLDRLIRWASRSRRPDCPSEVVELAAITLAWTFTSPNRILRDHTTKSLSQLLSAHLPVLPALISRFAGVNDPYVIERLAVACHVAVLCGGTAEPQAVVSAANKLRKLVFADDQVPNLSTRDAVRGIYEWCLNNGWVDEQTYSDMKPPYSSALPLEPPTEEEVRRDYDIRWPESRLVEWPYGRLMGSVFAMGDFGRYVIEPAMHRFTRHSLRSAVPPKRKRTMLSADWGQRWVFQRVISLGWNPLDFAEFDQRVNYWSASRTEHKPERFGKKYQWIAFHELVARVADNFHMVHHYEGDPETYEGPWQLWSRDIDPTLPPPPRTRDMDGDVEVGKTFAVEVAQWWIPNGPRYRDDDPEPDAEWAREINDIPEFEPLVRRQDNNGNKWVVLHAWYNWRSTVTRPRRRELWSYIYSWLVRPGQRDAVVRYIERHSLMNDWMPGRGRNIDAAYLGELPWAMSRDTEVDVWEPITEPGTWKPTGLQVSPAWEEYEWEGNILDCSIDDGVRAWYPGQILFDAGNLVWKPGTREWCDSASTTVARFVESDDHSVLLVRDDWLKRTLRKVGLVIVFGWLGEKRFIEMDSIPILANMIGRWTEINSVATFDGRRWSFGRRRLETRSVPNGDADGENQSDAINEPDNICPML